MKNCRTHGKDLEYICITFKESKWNQDIKALANVEK